MKRTKKSNGVFARAWRWVKVVYRRGKKKVRKIVRQVVKAAKAVGRKVVKVAKRVAAPVIKAAKAVGRKVVKVAKRVAAPVVKAAKAVGRKVKKIAKRVAAPVVKAAKAVGRKVVKVAKAVVRTVVKAAKAVGRTVVKVVKAVIPAVVLKPVAAILAPVVRVVRAIGSGVVNAVAFTINQIAKATKGSGRPLLSRVWSGITAIPRATFNGIGYGAHRAALLLADGRSIWNIPFFELELGLFGEVTHEKRAEKRLAAFWGHGFVRAVGSVVSDVWRMFRKSAKLMAVGIGITLGAAALAVSLPEVVALAVTGSAVVVAAVGWRALEVWAEKEGHEKTATAVRAGRVAIKVGLTGLGAALFVFAMPEVLLAIGAIGIAGSVAYRSLRSVSMANWSMFGDSNVVAEPETVSRTLRNSAKKPKARRVTKVQPKARRNVRVVSRKRQPASRARRVVTVTKPALQLAA